MKRKILLIMLCGVMIFSITGCGSKEPNNNSNPEENSGNSTVNNEEADLSQYYDHSNFYGDILDERIAWVEQRDYNGTKYGYVNDKGEIVIPLSDEIIINLDDFGHQKSEFMSRDMFCEFIKPYEKQIYDAMKENGIICCHHSCGKIESLLEDIYDMGAQMVLGLFYPYNDQAAAAERMGGKLLFMMSINAQVLDTPEATVDDAVEDAMRQLRTLGPKDALIFTPAASRPDLAEAMMDVYFRHRDEYNPYKEFK